MNLDRRLGNFARARNHLIRMPFHETVEDLGLALRQTRVIPKGYRRLSVLQGADADGYIFVFGAVRLKLDL